MVVPDVRIHLVEGKLSAGKRSNSAAMKIQIEIYGASKGVETWFETPGMGQFFFCTELSQEAKGERRRLECVLQSEGEGKHVLTVDATGASGRTVEAFSWTYDVTPPKVSLKLASQREWGRDDTLYVQMESTKADMDWERTELFFDAGQQHRAIRTACPGSLPVKPQAECFAVSLAQLPQLPHGDYPLNLTARPVDEVGNTSLHVASFNIRINRRLWSLDSVSGITSTGVVTREGNLVVVVVEDRSGQLEDFLVAIDTEGRRVWERRLSDVVVERRLLLGRHRDTDVVVASCAAPDGRSGFYAFHAGTGKALFSDCEEPRWDGSHWALLQGGPGKDLVVARRGSSGNNYILEACRFIQTTPTWRLDCLASGIFPDTGNSGLWTELLVRQTPGGASRVFADSESSYWCAKEWSNGNWSPTPDCAEEGPSMGPGLEWAQTHFLGSESRWVLYMDNTLTTGLRGFDSSNRPGATVGVGMRPLLMGADDELIGKNGREAIQRFSLAGVSLAEGTFGEAVELNQRRVALIESGDRWGNLVFPSADDVGETSVACLDSGLKGCWEGGSTEGASAQFLGILPKSSTRGVAVFGYDTDTLVGFLIDAPGLKANVPWPLWRHDLCRSSNANVPIDNCWDGPRP